jgi:TonB family protein
MPEIKNINLSFNCPNTKESLNEANGEFNCKNCSKQVIDFTNKTQSELLQILNSSNSKVCGIFKPSQLSRTFLKYAAATAIVGGSFFSAANGQHVIETDSVEHACELMGDIVFGEVVNDSGAMAFYYPEPIGGMAQLYNTIMNEIRYPDQLKVDGRTFLQFTVDTTGQITTIKVVKGFNEIADNEAVRALNATNFPFKPANKNGIPVESQLIIPVNFKKEK